MNEGPRSPDEHEVGVQEVHAINHFLLRHLLQFLPVFFQALCTYK